MCWNAVGDVDTDDDDDMGNERPCGAAVTTWDIARVGGIVLVGGDFKAFCAGVSVAFGIAVIFGTGCENLDVEVVDVVVVLLLQLVVVIVCIDECAVAAARAAAANETMDKSVGNISGWAPSRSCVINGIASRAFHCSHVRPAMRVMLRSSATVFVVVLVVRDRGIWCICC